MTDNNEIESLKAEINSLFELVKTNAEAKVTAQRKELIKEISELSAVLGQEFKEEEYKDTPLDSLQFNARVLRDTIKALKYKSDSGDLAGLVVRDNEDLDELSGNELEDVILSLIQLSFGLEPTPDEINEQIRHEREAEGYTIRR